MLIIILIDVDDDDNDDMFIMIMGGYVLLMNMVFISDFDLDDNRWSLRGVSKKFFLEMLLWKIDWMNWIVFYGVYIIDKIEEFN